MLASATFAIAAAIPTAVVSDALHANIDGADAALGANIYAGDSLATSEGGSLRLRIGKGQLFMLSQSDATVTQDHELVDVLMKRGTLGFSATVDDPIEIDTPVGMLRPANTQRALGQVTLDGPRQIIVTSYEGTLALTHAGETRTIEEGKSYRVMLASTSPGPAPAAPTNGQGSGAGSGNNNGLIFDGVVIGASVGVGLLLWRLLCDSETSPRGCH